VPALIGPLMMQLMGIAPCRAYRRARGARVGERPGRDARKESGMAEGSGQQVAGEGTAVQEEAAALGRVEGGASRPPIETRLVQGLERIVTALGERVRRARSTASEPGGAPVGQEPASGEGASARPSPFRVPDEVRGIVERYPVQSLIASWGAGYIIGALSGSRRR